MNEHQRGKEGGGFGPDSAYPPPLNSFMQSIRDILFEQLLADIAAKQWEKERMTAIRKDRQLLVQWHEQMVLCFERELTPEERADLERWDREWVDGGAGIGTSDWPGWAKHIGPKPVRTAHIDRRRTA